MSLTAAPAQDVQPAPLDTAVSVAPLIVGIGGTTRHNSTSERVLARAMAIAAENGCRTRFFTGEYLASLPFYDPRGPSSDTLRFAELIDAVRASDGLIISSPAYHGSLPGLLKNALDALEDLREGDRPYLHGRAVGCMVCAQGGQAGPSTLNALRSVIHALRGWPTPFGVAVDAASVTFDSHGHLEPKDLDDQIARLVGQVAGFARMGAVF